MTANAPVPVEAQFLTVSDVAGYLQVSIKTVRRLILRGELRAYRVGRSLRVAPADVDRCLKKRQVAKTAHAMVSGDEPDRI